MIYIHTKTFLGHSIREKFLERKKHPMLSKSDICPHLEKQRWSLSILFQSGHVSRLLYICVIYTVTCLRTYQGGVI